MPNSLRRSGGSVAGFDLAFFARLKPRIVDGVTVDDDADRRAAIVVHVGLPLHVLHQGLALQRANSELSDSARPARALTVNVFNQS